MAKGGPCDTTATSHVASGPTLPDGAVPNAASQIESGAETRLRFDPR